MTTNNQDNAKRLAKNTFLLYFRMLFLLLVSLYTSRVNLQALGIDDFGIYNVVGGFIAMFSIVSNSLSNSVSRYLNFELGKGAIDKLKSVFSTSVNIQLVLSVIVVLLAETFGLWFLNNKMVISSDRIIAANWVFQLSLCTFVLGLLSVPFNAVIVAHEKMSTFAYISIVEGIAKIIIAFLISYSPFDKLIFFSLLYAILSLGIRLLYGIYSKRHFQECSYKFIIDKLLMKEMFCFAGWNFIGSTSSLLRSHGVNILINLFYGTSVNAARAISMQVNNAVNGFVSNFMIVLTPQMTKAYAQNDFDYLLSCIYKGSKFSFFLLYVISLPILIETDYILELWLVEVPPSTVSFVRFILLYSLADTYLRSMIIANNATGDIKIYQLVVGGLNLLVFPLVYIIFLFDSPAEYSVLVSIAISLVGIFPRIHFIKKHIPISYKGYIFNVLKPTLMVSLISCVIPLIFHFYGTSSFYNLFIVIGSSVLASLFFIWLFGCDKIERGVALSYLKKKVSR